jgi:hypothetical protein
MVVYDDRLSGENVAADSNRLERGSLINVRRRPTAKKVGLAAVD